MGREDMKIWFIIRSWLHLFFSTLCFLVITSDPGSRTHISPLLLMTLEHFNQGCSPRPTPPRPAEKWAAPPRPAEIDKSRGAQRGKANYKLHRLCPPIWAESGEMKEKLFIWSFVQLVIIWFAERPFKVRECNVFLDQNTIL